jgi:type I restriction enzyme S subunit
MNSELLLAHFDRISEAPDAVPRLRSFILDLAVRGKLVEQDPKDEPASELLKRIRMQKARMVEKGEIRKQETLPVKEDEEPFAIPANWAWTRLGQIGDWGSGSTPSRGNYDLYGGGITWLKSGELNDNRQLTSSEETVTKLAISQGSFRQNQSGDVLIAMYGATIGKVAILAKPAVTNQAVCGCTPFSGVSNLYLFNFLLSQRTQFHSASEGGAQPNISKIKILRFPFALPPLAEQHRIVAKVDELMALCDRLKASQCEREARRDRLVAASHYHLNVEDAKVLRRRADFFIQHIPPLTARPDQIRQLRQTILSLAVRGKLISQDTNDEPASELLKRIRIEEQRLVDGGKIKKQKPHAVLSKQDTPFCLPVQWEWVRLSTIADVQDPNPSHRMPQYVQSGGIPFISSENFVEGDQIDFQIGKRVTQKTLDEQIGRFSILAGALAFTRIGTIGKSRFLPAERTYGISHAVCVLNPLDRSALSMPFLRATLGAEAILAFAHRGTRSIGVPDLGMAVVRGMAIPLPPIAEQHRIVARVAELMSLCDRLEAQLSNARSESRRLLDAVLHDSLGQARLTQPEAAPLFA